MITGGYFYGFGTTAVVVKKNGQRLGNCLPNLNLTQPGLYPNISFQKKEFSSIITGRGQKGRNL